jgi:formylglycine-generating enzyme required for sulfatase activity
MAPILLARADFSVGQAFTDELRSGGNGPQMVVIPGGRFVMGGWPLGKDELGVVKIDYRLAFGATEVTVGQYRQFLKATQSASLRKLPKGGDDLPITRVSWDDAEAYVNWLSRQTGHYYRLPSASEWEYAARAGTTTIYSWGDSAGKNKANCLNCNTPYEGKLAPVGSFSANAWGLYDMHGNVWEWTKDCIDPNTAPPIDGSPQLFGNCESRELRGGSAQSDSWSIRGGARAFALRKMKDDDVGFRVVRDISE